MSKQHAHLRQQDQGGVFSTAALPKLICMARVGLLPERHSVSHAFSLAFPCCEDWLVFTGKVHRQSHIPMMLA